MSKKICKDEEILEKKSRGRKNKFTCRKCGLDAPKEKWVCKPVAL